MKTLGRGRILLTDEQFFVNVDEEQPLDELGWRYWTVPAGKAGRQERDLNAKKYDDNHLYR